MTNGRRLTTMLCVASVLAGSAGAPLIADEGATSVVRVAELSPGAEAAITRGLRYLAARQLPDGSWPGRYRVAATSLGLMAFMVKGYFPGRGMYGRQLDRSVAFLIQESKAGGGYMGQSMYEHGLATLALSEAWGMSDSEEIRRVLARAVGVIVGAQRNNRTGGWRYQPTMQSADISVTVMQIVALASAKEAGIHVPDTVLERAIAYVRGLQHAESGGFGYNNPNRPGFARTAAGVLSLQLAGERNSPQVKAGLGYLMRLMPKVFSPREKWFFYGHYYAVQAMYQAGERNYQRWYPQIRDSLLAAQDRQTGGWRDSHGIGTQMAILILGVPYRFLPIYQR